METIKIGAFEFTPADNDIIERFMKNLTSYKSLDDYLLMVEDDIDTRGIVMNDVHTTALVVRDTGWFNQMKDKYKEAEYELVKLTMADLNSLIDEDKYLCFNKSFVDPQYVLKAMKMFNAFGDDGRVDGVEAMSGEDQPVWFRNEEGYGIIISPCIGYNPTADLGVTQHDLEKKEFADIREWRMAQEDPDIVRIYLHDGGKMNVRWDGIEGLARNIDGWYIILRGSNADLDDWKITEKTKDEILENLPDIETSDVRGKVIIDHERLTYEVEKAWKKHDPTFDDAEGYAKCFKELVEWFEYYNGPGCTIDFYVQHFGEEPPTKLTKHRSNNTPEEWARALIKLVQLANITRVNFTKQDDHNEGTLTISFVDLEAKIPDVRVTEAQYKASHLLEFMADVDFTDYNGGGGRPYKIWEDLSHVTDFEDENVRA